MSNITKILLDMDREIKVLKKILREKEDFQAEIQSQVKLEADDVKETILENMNE